MKKDGKYRFSLQFPAETEEQITAGELLERLGNKKSAVVVQALYDFAVAHPKLLQQNGKIEVTTTLNLTPEYLEKLIDSALNKRLDTDLKGITDVTGSQEQGGEIAEMLGNLDIFQ